MTPASTYSRPPILYIESTLPDGQTIPDYRRSRPARRRGWRRLLRAGSSG